MVAVPQVTSPSACFVVEASPAVGGGHLARCAALAEFWSMIGTRSDLRYHGEHGDVLPKATAAFNQARAGVASAARFERAVFDGYSIDAAVEHPWRRQADVLMAFDDLADRHHDVDVLVDTGPLRDASDYAGKVPASCRVLTGLSYVPIRSTLMSARPRERRPDPDGALVVMMGASDPANVTATVLEALGQAAGTRRIQVVLGPSAPHLPSVRASFSDRAEILVDPADLEQLLLHAGLVIGAAGSSALERACLGVPQVACVLAENQVGLAKGLRRLGAATVLDRHEWNDPRALQAAVLALLHDPHLRGRQSDAGLRAVDGRGVQRITAAMTRPAELGEDRLVLRLFEPSDSDWLLWLQSRPETRRYARRPEPPTADEHDAWVKSLLAARHRMLFVVELSGIAVGYVRLDVLGEEQAEVSIAIDAAWHRRGVAGAALSVLRGLSGLRLQAFVLEENAPSRKLFEASGYRFIRQADGGRWYESIGT
ncbi:UDP-2,4-diacetamido-2,4,6-trideoxy-beta-L-altropyranose hydrolase [Alsobacter sp. R-9]